MEGLERADDSEEEQLQCKPFTRPYPIEDHVGRDFKEDDPEGKHLLADIELVLSDADVLHKVVGKRIRDVATIYARLGSAVVAGTSSDIGSYRVLPGATAKQRWG